MPVPDGGTVPCQKSTLRGGASYFAPVVDHRDPVGMKEEDSSIDANIAPNPDDDDDDDDDDCLYDDEDHGRYMLQKISPGHW